MAKKKIKKPVSKRVAKPRTTRATLEQRNETLGQPKARKPRAKKIKQDAVEVTITEGPATQWVSGSADDFLDDNHPQVVSKVVSWVSSTEPAAPSIPTSGSVFIPNYPNQKVEFTKVNKNGWADAAGEVYDDFICKMQKSEFTTTIRDFAFAHPLIFGIAFCTGILCVLTVTAVAARYFGW